MIKHVLKVTCKPNDGTGKAEHRQSLMCSLHAEGQKYAQEDVSEAGMSLP